MKMGTDVDGVDMVGTRELGVHRAESWEKSWEKSGNESGDESGDERRDESGEGN
jgi:hypothetical protein